MFLAGGSGLCARLRWPLLVWGSISAPSRSWDHQQDVTASGLQVRICWAHLGPEFSIYTCSLTMASNTTYMLMTPRFISPVRTFPLSCRLISLSYWLKLKEIYQIFPLYYCSPSCHPSYSLPTSFWTFSLFAWNLSGFMINTFQILNFPPDIVLANSPKFWHLVLSCLALIISLLVHRLLSSIFTYFPDIRESASDLLLIFVAHGQRRELNWCSLEIYIGLF